MKNRKLFRKAFCTGFILAGLMFGVNVYAAAPSDVIVTPTQAPAAAQEGGYREGEERKRRSRDLPAPGGDHPAGRLSGGGAGGKRAAVPLP